MFDQALDSVRKASEGALQSQQELFKKWAGLWSGFPASLPSSAGQDLKFQERWANAVDELVRMQSQVLEMQCSALLRNIQDAFRLAQARDFEVWRSKTAEMWQRSVDCLWHAYEAQIRAFQTAVTKMTEPVVMKGKT